MKITRRNFLKMSGIASAAALAGCATNPVTGKSQFMLMSESGEVDLDRKYAPHQFSSNFGAVQDANLNRYLSELGMNMAVLTHRPAMPYNFRVLNMVDVNAYTFPGGSMGFGRGLMLGLGDEAEIAAVIGHELGHVNARHTAQLQTRGILAQLIVAGAAAYVGHKKGDDAGAITAGIGMIGSNALLCKYSRNHEREADALGMEYMVRANYNPAGMIGVMDAFRKMQKEKPNIVEVLFSTHPMSEERYKTAVSRVESNYAHAKGFPRNREKYMDNTASLRRNKTAIENMQKGEGLMGQSKFPDAEAALKAALVQMPDDYAGLLLMASCCAAQKKLSEAEKYAQQAHAVYPEEPLAQSVLGVIRTKKGEYGKALNDFSSYEKALPGNPSTVYNKAFCYDKMGKKEEAKKEYLRYQNEAPGGEYSSQVASRLTELGYKAQ